jgi:hypothetical protein
MGFGRVAHVSTIGATDDETVIRRRTRTLRAWRLTARRKRLTRGCLLTVAVYIRRIIEHATWSHEGGRAYCSGARTTTIAGTEREPRIALDVELERTRRGLASVDIAIALDVLTGLITDEDDTPLLVNDAHAGAIGALAVFVLAANDFAGCAAVVVVAGPLLALFLSSPQPAIVSTPSASARTVNHLHLVVCICAPSASDG